MINVQTRFGKVEISFTSHNTDGTVEQAHASGASLTEAVTNLILRFEELQTAVFDDLRAYGFIETRSTSKGEAP